MNHFNRESTGNDHFNFFAEGNKNMQKSLLAAMILALGVVACGKKQEAAAPAPAPAPAPAAEQKPADAAPAPAAPAAQPAKK
ncbi:MAG: hypothetical protein EBU75_05760 [Betaproteobacteria bacterium]|jgi:hypothetical protein|nr:hypothetical protein [Betaproteobacteria bacterium]